MTDVRGRITEEFDRYPSYARGENLTRSLFDVDLHNTLRALAAQDEALPLLAAHRLRRELQSNPSWDTCLAFVAMTLADVVKDPTKYALDTTNSTRNSRHFDEQRAEATGMLFHYQYSEDPLYNIAQSLSYGLLWAYERNQYDKLDLTGKIVGTFSVQNHLGAHLMGDYSGEVVQPAMVFNSAITGALITYDLIANDQYSCDGRYFWVKSTGDSSSLDILEHNQFADQRVNSTFFADSSIGDFHVVAQVSIDEQGVCDVDGPARFQDLLNNS